MAASSQERRRTPLRVLLTGATGFIGSAVRARLIAEGIEVAGVTRAPRREPDWVTVDMARAVRAEDWLAHLAGIDAVVNCAGVLQDRPGNSVRGVHERGAAALFAACERAGVRRVIHVSAIGVDRETPTEFSRSKQAGDAALMARDLDWIILRPSVVVGRPAFGGSALFRGLAALPLLPLMEGTGPLQVVQLDEVVETVRFFLRPEAPAKVALELAGPERLALPEVVAAYRRWLRFPPARRVRLPGPLTRLAFALGDFAGMLGWRPPIRGTVAREILRGAVGDPSQWSRMTGISPRPLAQALAAEPASVQERWFARLYFLKPVIFVTFSLFWIATGLVSLGPGFDVGMEYLDSTAMAPIAPPAIIAGALADLAVGLMIAIRPTARLGLWLALAVSLFYALAGTVFAAFLWSDPLGPMLKIWPIIALNLVALAILEDR